MPGPIQCLPLITIAGTVLATSAAGQSVDASYSHYGTPGLLEMPTAASATEHDLAATLSYTEDLARVTLTFQVTPRLSASFRFASVEVFEDPPESDREIERGFDLRYRLNNETDYLPAVAIGLQDFLTPGRFQSEYIVASKSFGDSLIVTAGLGWGAFGTRDGFNNPLGSDLEERPVFDPSEPDGQLASDYWFRGDAAVFGGFEYQINERWGLKAEYSTNAYPVASGNVAIEPDSPYNYGLTYRPRDGIQIGLSYLYGNQVALSGTFSLNPNERANGSGLDRAPAPVKVRETRAAQSWDRTALPDAALRRALAGILKLENITLTGLELTDRTARIRYVNNRYRSEVQAAGRVARMMTQVLPESIETFILEPERQGIPLSAITISRSNLEDFENQVGGSEAIRQNANLRDAGANNGVVRVDADSPAFTWGLGPYFRINPFVEDGDNAVDLGLNLRGVYTIRPNLIASATIGQSLIPPDDDPDGTDATPDIQNVRTDGGLYGDDGVPVLEQLTLTHFSRPGPDLYGRVTVGYLERMFGGVSGELLWKQVDSPFGLGIELNQVAQRDTDMRFGFEEYDYDVTTGHVSAYYDLGNGYQTQLDVGRYLAGDWGATLSVDREFENGWVIGAYVTQTELTYEEFGNGSYNKGVQITIPQDYLSGTPTRGTYSNTFRTRVGDGGARLNVNGRLYDVVRDAHQSDLDDTWGRFWR